MPDIVERTALTSFHLNGSPVRKGQVVTVDPLQLARLVKAGCVVESEGENAALPKADLPATQTAGIDYQAEIDEAAASATKTIAVIRQGVEAAIAKADAEILAHEERARAAGVEADEAIKAHGDRAAKAGTDADAEISAHRERIAAATAETVAEEGASTPPPVVDGGKPGRGRS